MKKINFILISAVAMLLAAGAAELRFKGRTSPAEGQRSIGYWGICRLENPVTVTPGMELVYEIMLEKGSNWAQGGIDLTGGTVGNLRDNRAVVDGDGLAVRGWAKEYGVWKERRFKLDPVAGKSFRNVDYMSGEIDRKAPGVYSARVRNLRLEIPGRKPLKFKYSAERGKDNFRNFEPLTTVTGEPEPAGKELEKGAVRLTSRSAVGDVHDFVVVAITPPGWSFTLPDQAFLSYEVKLLPDSVNRFAGINLMFDGQDLRYRYNRENEIITDVSAFRGRWGKRKIDLSRLANRRMYEAYAVAGFHQMSPGSLGAEFRNTRIVDGNDRTLCDLTPGDGTLLYYPLLHHTKFVTDVKLEIPGAAGARFRPSKYLADDTTALTGTLYLHNFDPAAAQELDYSLELGNRNIASGKLLLKPGESRELPVRLGKLAAGDYRPMLKVNGGQIREFAISVLTAENLKKRRRAWQPGGTALGIVPMTSSGAGGIWNIPAMRELGGNYYQCRIDWALLETAPGKFDFNWFLPYLEMAQDCGVDVQLDFYSGYPAYSVPAAYRRYEMLLNDGSRHGGTGSPVAYWSPGFTAGLAAMSGFYSAGLRHPAVLSFNAWTGGSMDSYYGLLSGRERKLIMDYSPWAAEQFRHFVREVLNYPLDEVNRKYGLNLRSFDELEPPQPRRGGLDLRPYWHDFMRYRSWSVNRMQDRSSQAVRQLSADAEIEYLYGGGLLASRQSNDYNQGLLNAQKHNGSIHHTAAPGAVDLMFLGALTRNFGVPFSIETAGTPAAMPEHQWAMYELLREGAAGYTWISSPGLTYRPPSSYGMGEYRQAFGRLRDARPPAPAIALIAGTSQQKMDIFNESAEVRTALQQLRELATHLEAAGYETDVFTDETPGVDFGKYALVIEPGSAALTRECADALTGYVRGGGKLLALERSGRYTPGAPDERFRLLKALKQNPGKGEVRIPAALPSVRKAAGVKFRQLSSRYHNGVYPSELDALIGRFAGVAPRIVTDEDNIYLALRQHDDRYFTILFNNSDRLRRFSYRPEIPAGDYFVYDLVRRRGRRADGFSGVATAQLMPYEIIVEEWSKRPVELPVYDAPLPRRRYVAPDQSDSGHRLAARFSPAGVPEEHPDFTVLPVRVAPNATFAPEIPGPGSYELNIALTGSRAPALRIETDGRSHELRELDRYGDFAIYSSRGTPLKLAPGSAIAFRNAEPLKIVYTELVPDFVPLEKLTATPGRPNPGRYDGPAFRAPLPEFAAIAGRTLTGVKGLFDLSGPEAGGVTEIAWETDSPEEQPGLLAVSADFGLRLALNGEEIFDSTRHSRQAPFPREFLLPVRFQKGVNRFVGRVTSGNDGWRFWCEMMRL